MNKPRPLLRRRQFLILGAASVGLCSSLCAASTLAGVLLARRIADINAETAVASRAPLPTTTIMPPIVPRVAWNARPVNHQAEQEKGFASADNPDGWYVYPGDLTQVYRTVAIHHSYPILRDTGTMRQIQDLHMDSNQWADIAYHFGIDGRGLIYMGRDIHARGASVAGHNTGTIGVVVIGDFETEFPTTLQLSALQSLVNWLAATYHLTHLAGHYDFNPQTMCPGAHLRTYLDSMARLAGLQRGTAGYVAPPAFGPGTAVCC